MVTSPHASMATVVQSVVGRIAAHDHRRDRPLVVALDGQSGAGKSTLASALAAARDDVVIVPLDDFFSASVPAAQWDAWTPAERATHVIDWTRLRTDVLLPLRAGRPACWHPFDFAAGPRHDGSYALHDAPVRCAPQALILLEGAYAASPQLADLVDLAILVEAPAAVRESRLRRREAATFLAAWHERWDAVEAHYAQTIRPRASFDLIVALDDVDPSSTPAAAG